MINPNKERMVVSTAVRFAYFDKNEISFSLQMIRARLRPDIKAVGMPPPGSIHCPAR
jgi:hypothetical protein